MLTNKDIDFFISEVMRKDKPKGINLEFKIMFPEYKFSDYSTIIFTSRASIIHKGFYSYDNVKYINNRKPVIITCPVHGDFLQAPAAHLVGKGCRSCAGNLLDLKGFLSKAKSVHGDTYSYSNTKYVNSLTKLSITCPIHGDFTQTPGNHLKGAGCPSCSGNKKFTTEEFIIRARKAHGDSYMYDKVCYDSAHSPVIITCKSCLEDFYQTPNNHVRGQGCPKCCIYHKKTAKVYLMYNEEYDIFKIGKSIDPESRSSRLSCDWNSEWIIIHTSKTIKNSYLLEDKIQSSYRSFLEPYPGFDGGTETFKFTDEQAIQVMDLLDKG